MIAGPELITGKLDIFEKAFEPQTQTEGSGSEGPPVKTAVDAGDYEDREDTSSPISYHVYRDSNNYKRGLRGFMQECYEAGLIRKFRVPVFGRLTYELPRIPVIGRFLYF